MINGEILFNVQVENGKTKLNIIWVREGQGLDPLLSKTLILTTLNRFRHARVRPGRRDEGESRIVFDISNDDFTQIINGEDYVASILWDENHPKSKILIVAIATKSKYNEITRKLDGIRRGNKPRQPLPAANLALCPDSEL